MDTKQQPKPAPSKLVKARVMPSNKYGTAQAGEIVEVDPSELEICSHCLESLDAEKARESVKVKTTEDDTERLRILAERRAALFAARDAAIQGRRIARERALNRQIAAQKAAQE